MDYQQSHLKSNRPRHNSVPFHIPTNEHNVSVQSAPQHGFSSPGALNRSEYQRNFKECIREYGPRPQQPSLFLFGRDQFERCETREVHLISPESGYSDPNPQTHFESNASSLCNIKSPSSAPEFETNQKSSEAFRSSQLNTLARQPSWPYEPLAQYTTNEPTTPTSAHTHRWPSGERKSPNIRSPNLLQRSSTSMPTISRPQSRAQDIFNFPEVLNDLQQCLNNHEHPANRSPISSAQNLQKSDDEFELRSPQKRHKFFGMNENDHSPTVEHQQHQSMIAELKSRFQKLQEQSSKFNVPLPTPISPTMRSKPKSPQISPHHQPIPADPPSNQSLPKSHDPIMELKRILQSDSQVLPVIELFLQSNFKIDHEKTFDFKDVQESEIPLQHYWERMFEVTDERND
ncbi:hypothetical protein M3Y98_00415100 [Aphelenchoides besseyi]|nr:hypothetical protein M3Y98_00415100 [Aphelenchoides besseyi]